VSRDHRRWLIISLALISTAVDASESDANDTVSVVRLFTENAMLNVSIEAPLTTLMRERPDEDYLDGRFRLTNIDGSEKVLDLKLRTRGNYRRDRKHCDFAPIRLNFRTKQVADTVLEGQDKLKLVTHCRNRNPQIEQYVLREYLTYRLLNAMTTRSYGVRLMRITYIDTEGGGQMTKLGFVIEDDEDVAERNGMRVVKTGGISSDDVEPGEQNFVHVFQYMIGNTEYSLVKAEPDKDCCHNIDLLSNTGNPPFTPLAYDFDFAGIVNAPYAEPNPKYNLRTVRQRLYKGRCDNNELLQGTIQGFHDNKDTIFDIVNGVELFTARSRRYVTRYLNLFFENTSQPEFIKARLIDNCNDAYPN
jgi:hypothetical protein